MQEKGQSSGFGLGYGYSRSFKDKWAFFIWAQAIAVDGSSEQFLNGQMIAQADQFEVLAANLAFGVSYEFFRDSPKHTLNVFGGLSFQYLYLSSKIATYGPDPLSDFDFETSMLMPGFVIGTMYDFRLLENWQFVPYGILSYTTEEGECQSFEAKTVRETTSSNGSAQGCTASDDMTRGEFKVNPSFLTLGINFNYTPWGLNLNVSSLIRNLIFDPDDENKAEIEAAYFSISKTWEYQN